MPRELKIIYMGTPDFAVTPLKSILDAGYNVSAVVTVPDKPVGRGQQMQMSAVKKFAIENGLPVMQPENLKSNDFIEELKKYEANLFVVVAFRMLPETVWSMPAYGTINLHASLLPQYRGAAPINHALINGETQTGVTTFFIEKQIDTGKIIIQDTVEITREENAGTLHDKLMFLGSKTLVRTLELISENKIRETDQKLLISNENSLKQAPKIYKQDCLINWAEPGMVIYNKIRGLSPYPCAHTHIGEGNKKKQLKIFKARFVEEDDVQAYGKIITDNKNILGIYVKDGIVYVEEVQLEGKKRMTVNEFLRGFAVKAEEKMY